jgi:DNA invertase Pin-like site-specific DNA recombinase
MAALAEFKRRERIRSGIAAAKARGKQLGRQSGTASVGSQARLSKNTVGAIIQRARSTHSCTR